MNHQQLYLELYKEYRIEIRHQEAQRSAVSTICVGLAAGLIGLGLRQQEETKPLLGVLLINFSLVAIFILEKLYERFALGKERARLYLEQIDRCPRVCASVDGKIVAHDGPRLSDIWEEGQINNQREYPFLSHVRLHYLWSLLLVGAGLIGILFVAQIPLTSKWVSPVLASLGLLFQTAIICVSQRRERGIWLNRSKSRDERSAPLFGFSNETTVKARQPQDVEVDNALDEDRRRRLR